jgi:citronellol/citronellal dehydrogenase
MKLEGKVAIVTGASRGIGKAIALGLAQEGADVVIASRTEHSGQHFLPGSIEETAQEVQALGRRALPLRADISDEESVADVVRRTLDAFGRIDILVNNAAVAHYASVAEMPPKKWDLVIRVNLRGTFLCSQAVLPSMMKQHRGSIVNISSRGADFNVTAYTGVAYAAAKAAIERFTNALAEEVLPYNIAVNALKPRGAVSTEGMRWWNPKADYSRWDKPEDFMVKAALFLAGQDSAGITGQVFLDADLCRRYRLT